ncbi:Subtilisin-like protease SBT1.7 [Linum perenne]
MAPMVSSILLHILFLLISHATSLSTSPDRKTYIVHMDKSATPSVFPTPHDWYTSLLSSISSADLDSQPIHLYTYKHVINGFSAVLSQAQLDKLEQIHGHVASFPESYGRRHTTHSPRFLGLNKHTGLWPAGKFGDDVIIGVLDTGIWPESESFNDELMPPVPSRWRGTCEIGVEFNASHCNRKLIGARKFSKGMEQQGLNISTTNDYDSPRDFLGHGTHTSSTAAGSRVPNVDYFGYAHGTATGIAPLARLAMYKVLFNVDVDDAEKSYDAAATDVLAGMDQAIEDGVDVMSLSLGFFETVPFFKNPIAIGAFAAMKRGIFVACSAGNGGPHGYTMLNGAPWIMTVGAGTLDRDLGAQITLGEGDLTVTGHSMYPENLFINRVPLYFGRGNRSTETCDVINLSEAAGKFVFCDHDDEDTTTKGFRQSYDSDGSNDSDAAVVGIIKSTDDAEFYSHATDFDTPYVMVSTKIGDLVKRYILNSTNSTVSVNFGITILGHKPAPKVTYFSSRGPDERSPWILKPDILAPGYDIIAAWVPNRAFAPIRGGDDYLQTDYAIISGTSMSCPHIAGVVALLRSAHEDWTLAAIRSAMMTSTYITDNIGGTIIDMTTGVGGTPLDFGAGHVNPNSALDPGLVYDIKTDDYTNYLCAMNYSKSEIAIITGEPPNTINCTFATLDLNYPSFMVVMNNTNSNNMTFSRVVTNVAPDGGPTVYHAVVQAPGGMKVVVEPPVIRFRGRYDTAAFSLNVDVVLKDGFGESKSDYIGNYGYLSWVEENGRHVVRSPIVSAMASPRT